MLDSALDCLTERVNKGVVRSERGVDTLNGQKFGPLGIQATRLTDRTQLSIKECFGHKVGAHLGQCSGHV